MPSAMLSWVITSPSSTATSSSRPRASGAVAMRLKRAITSASRISFRAGGARVLGDRVEQPVDEPAFAFVVKGVGDVDIFGDDRADRHIGPSHQLIGAGAKDRSHRPVEPLQAPALREPSADERVDLLPARVGAGDDVIEEVPLGIVIMLVLNDCAEPVVVKFLEQASDCRALHVVLVERLDGGEARGGTRSG